ncbi:MAG TPA: hypothetical protein VMZ90_03505 [Vicinamibacterales bacterium]|nr:hypothetical protein [Vicinamibacterales bacterium]
MPPVVQIQVQRAPGDCAICALSMYLGRPYEDVLGAAVSTTKRSRIHHVGMFTREMKRTAAKLGVTLTLRRGFELDSDEGVLAVARGEAQHAVLLKAGLIFDGDGTVWEPDTFLAHYQYRPISLLVRDED